MMENEFQSKALEVNLVETSRRPIDLSEQENWFISLSTSLLGIHERTASFFNELHHSYPNYPWIVDNFKKLCLGDFWFYQEVPEANRAFQVIVESFEDLFSRNLPDKEEFNLFQTLLQFLGELLRLDDPPQEVVERILSLVQKLLDSKTGTVLNGANFLRQISYPRTHDNGISGEFFHLLKNIITLSLEYWRETAHCSDWIADRTHLFPSLNSRDMEQKIGEDFFSSLQRDIKKVETWD